MEFVKNQLGILLSCLYHIIGFAIHLFSHACLVNEKTAKGQGIYCMQGCRDASGEGMMVREASDEVESSRDNSRYAKLSSNDLWRFAKIRLEL